MNKKGVFDMAVLELIVFVILNIVFFTGMVTFVYAAGNKGFVYEEIYAKQIAMVVDNAKPEMVVLMNIADIKAIAEKKGKSVDKIFSVDNSKNQIRVSLSSSNFYAYNYFMNYDVELKTNNEWLSIIVKERTG